MTELPQDNPNYQALVEERIGYQNAFSQILDRFGISEAHLQAADTYATIEVNNDPRLLIPTGLQQLLDEIYSGISITSLKIVLQKTQGGIRVDTEGSKHAESGELVSLKDEEVICPSISFDVHSLLSKIFPRRTYVDHQRNWDLLMPSAEWEQSIKPIPLSLLLACAELISDKANEEFIRIHILKTSQEFIA